MTKAKSFLCGAALFWVASAVHAASHDDFLGDGVRFNYVALAGYGGNNDVNRKNLQDTYDACFKQGQLAGRSVKLNELTPDIASKISVEIYYTENRTLEILETLNHSINVLDCGVEPFPKKIWTLRSSAGICRADLTKKIAEGMCDFQSHQRATGTGSRTANQASPSIDLSKIPPHARPQVEAAMKANAGSLAAGYASVGFVNTMQTNSVAGMPCQIYLNSSLKQEQCMAALEPTASPQFNPKTVVTWGLNGGLRGVLLQLKSPALTLQAQNVSFNLAVTPSFFDLPAGVKVTSTPRVKP